MHRGCAPQTPAATRCADARCLALQKWFNKSNVVQWNSKPIMSKVNKTVMLTRELPNSLYMTVMTDTANAYAMLCGEHGQCDGASPADPKGTSIESLVVFIDGSGDGTFASPYTQLWDCLTGADGTGCTHLC